MESRDGARPQRVTGDQALRIDPVTALPQSIAVGGGAALFLDGRCSHPAGSIRKLIVSLSDTDGTASGRSEQPAFGWELAPPPGLGGRNDYWWAVVKLLPTHDRHGVTVELDAVLRDGSRASGTIGAVELLPRLEPSDRGVSPVVQIGSREHDTRTRSPLVAICMATYNPPADLFARQIESIKQQTHHEWICVISDGGSTPEAIGALKKAIGDDARFQLSISESRLGVYDNFERALLMVPAAANYVAFCDQDDYWRSDKLDALLAGLEPGSLLVYSDARIVDAQGHIIDETLWRAGPIDHAEFASLMLTTRGNIPGAAMLFDATLLEDALPFPPGYPGWYHDFWMSRLAATLGPLSYVDAPLYDYVQHEHQTLGASRDRTGESTSKRIAPLGGKAMHPSWRRYLYFDDFLRVLLASQTLEVRCAGRMSRDRVRTLKAVADSPRGITWLVLRGARHWFGAANTRRAERNILEGFMWRRCADLRKRSRQRASLRRRYW